MNKILLVTGASRGIGAATAILAAQRGYRVAVNYRANATAAESVVAQIQQAGGQAFAVQADVSREEDVLRLFAHIDAEDGSLEALVNNVGTLETQMRVEDMTAERINRIFTTNVTGTMLCTREAIKRMSTKHGGTGGAIVNVSSVAALIGSPNEYVDYAASKGAVDTFTLGVAREVATEGIRVNGVRPGIIYTDIHAQGGEPNRVDRVKVGVPMQRGGQPEEVASAILWLLSDEASYATATFIDVAGGR
ncbi:SDR family oxidoreductase [Salinispirillum sp. LH 10-3-1]|uniref:SDR family oxidoreductase n=1 Tax=Salinispirillum sp. LH 10-3-1 TaxID=2952525 RepID=A0AB38YEM7_9GAMM